MKNNQYQDQDQVWVVSQSNQARREIPGVIHGNEPRMQAGRPYWMVEYRDVHAPNMPMIRPVAQRYLVPRNANTPQYGVF